MSNPDAPYGLQPIRHLNGNPWNGQVEKCYVHASYATALYVGDPVDLQTETDHQDPTGKHLSIKLATAGNGNYILGVIVAFEEDPDNLGRIYLPASTGGYAYVCIDPWVVFKIRDDGATTPTKLFAGQNAVLIKTQAGDTTTGLSGWELDTSSDPPAADASNQLFILHCLDSEGDENLNDSGYAGHSNWEVLINLHRLRSTGDGDAALGVTAT